MCGNDGTMRAPVAHQSGAAEGVAASGTAYSARVMRQREGPIARVDASALRCADCKAHALPQPRQMQYKSYLWQWH